MSFLLLHPKHITIRNFCEEQYIYVFILLLHIAMAATLMLEWYTQLAACRANASIQLAGIAVMEVSQQSDTSSPC